MVYIVLLSLSLYGETPRQATGTPTDGVGSVGHHDKIIIAQEAGNHDEMTRSESEAGNTSNGGFGC